MLGFTSFFMTFNKVISKKERELFKHSSWKSIMCQIFRGWFYEKEEGKTSGMG